MARLGDMLLLIEQKPQQWEYKIVISHWDLNGTNLLLYNLGRDGWQLVTVTGEWWVFIRPSGESSKTTGD